MKPRTDRRTLLIAAGAAAVAVATGRVAAQPADIRGALDYQGGAVIPEGLVEIYLEDPAGRRDDAGRRTADARVRSDGKSRTIDFSVPLPARASGSPAPQIVARLERADGWLVARGSARVEAGSPVKVTLNTAMY